MTAKTDPTDVLRGVLAVSEHWQGEQLEDLTHPLHEHLVFFDGHPQDRGTMATRLWREVGEDPDRLLHLATFNTKAQRFEIVRDGTCEGDTITAVLRLVGPTVSALGRVG